MSKIGKEMCDALNMPPRTAHFAIHFPVDGAPYVIAKVYVQGKSEEIKAVIKRFETIIKEKA